MNSAARQDPLHGVTLQAMLSRLVDKYGWQELGSRIRIKCFTTNPSIKSSLTFLRRTPWAREQLESLYLETAWPTENIWTARRGIGKQSS